MMPGKMRSFRAKRASRLRRISSRTGRTRWFEALRSPSVCGDSTACTNGIPRSRCSADYTRGAARRTIANRSATVCEPGERRTQAVIGGEQVLRHDPHVGHHRHEVRVAGPARDDVPVEMVAHAGAARDTEVHPEVEAFGRERLGERAERPTQRLGEIGVLVGGKPGQIGRVTARGDHQVGVLVGKPIQHDEARPAHPEQQAVTWVSLTSGTEDAARRRPLADVRHAPGCPQHFHARLGYLYTYNSSARAGVQAWPSTRSASSFPTLKNGTRLAWTATSAPALGFRPSRAWRCFTTKLPKPRISMRSPRVRACVMLSKTAFTITSASRRENRGNCFSTSSIRSRLVMLSPGTLSS